MILKIPYIHRMNKEVVPRGLFFLAGAATGFALGVYLYSDKGSALRGQLQEHWDELLETFGERAREQLEALLARLNTALEKGLSIADDLEDQFDLDLEGMEEDTREAMEDAETSFENGMDKARARLRQKFAAAGIPLEEPGVN